jgi:hypothetical protein
MFQCCSCCSLLLQVYTYALEPLTTKSAMSPASTKHSSWASGGSGSGGPKDALVLPAAGQVEEEGEPGCSGEMEEVAAWCLK